MDIASFENLNTLYQFKAVDKYPRLKHPSLKRISLSTTALLGAKNGGVANNFRSTAVSIGSVGHGNNRNHTPETSIEAETMEELMRQSCEEVEGMSSFIVGFDDITQFPSPNSDHIYQASIAQPNASLPGASNQNWCSKSRDHILKQQPPMLNRSQTVQCLGGVTRSWAKQLAVGDTKQYDHRDASLENKNYYEWYDAKDKSGKGLKFIDKTSRAVTPVGGDSFGLTTYNTVPNMASRGLENIDKSSESYQSLLTKNQKTKLTTSVENLLALK